MVWKMATGGDWGAAVIRALIGAGVTFLAWAIGRELDPDRPWTAGVAAVLAAGMIGAGVPSLLVSGAVLLAARVTARTTGLAPRITDLGAVAGFAFLAGVSDAGLAVGVILGLVLVADRFLPGGALFSSVPMGILSVVVVLAATALWGTLVPAPGLPHGPEWAMVPAAVAGLAGLGRPRRVAAVGDFSGKALSVGRARLGRVVAVVAAALTFIWLGGAGLTSAAVVWAALAATALPGQSSND